MKNGRANALEQKLQIPPVPESWQEDLVYIYIFFLIYYGRAHICKQQLYQIHGQACMTHKYWELLEKKSAIEV